MVERLPAVRMAEALESSPITGVHLWFDRPVCPFDHVVTPGRLVQWVFNHTAIQGRSTPAGVTSPPDGPTAAREDAQYLQIVISASYDLLALSREAIRDAVIADLAAIWPAAREARLLRWWVVTEHGATFAVRPGVDACRPPQRTPDRRPLPCRRLDRHGMARDHGRRGPERLPGGARSSQRPRSARPPDPSRPRAGQACPLAARPVRESSSCPSRGQFLCRARRRDSHLRRFPDASRTSGGISSSPLAPGSPRLLAHTRLPKRLVALFCLVPRKLPLKKTTSLLTTDGSLGISPVEEGVSPWSWSPIPCRASRSCSRRPA